MSVSGNKLTQGDNMSSQAQLTYNGKPVEALVRRGRKNCRIRLQGDDEPDILVPTDQVIGLKLSKTKKAKETKAKMANGASNGASV